MFFSLIAQLHHIPYIEQVKIKRDLNKAFKTIQLFKPPYLKVNLLRL